MARGAAFPVPLSSSRLLSCVFSPIRLMSFFVLLIVAAPPRSRAVIHLPLFSSGLTFFSLQSGDPACRSPIPRLEVLFAPRVGGGRGLLFLLPLLNRFIWLFAKSVLLRTLNIDEFRFDADFAGGDDHRFCLRCLSGVVVGTNRELG